MVASANDQVMNFNNNPSIPLTGGRVDNDYHTRWLPLIVRLLTRLTRLICLLTLLTSHYTTSHSI